ncbi:MAG: hypothetical protein WDN50_13995 [Bradyrhizobium sp.]
MIVTLATLLLSAVLLPPLPAVLNSNSWLKSSAVTVNWIWPVPRSPTGARPAACN